jgi:nicotinate-nucleotide adenylyltransferase
MRLGIMGGTFDPIHNGHVFIADAARRACGLERVLFLPTGSPPHKGVSATAEQRYRMTALAVADLPWAEVSRLETDREGASYTADTLSLLREQRPCDALYMIVGADALHGMPQWRDARRAMTLCEVVAVARPGLDEDVFRDALRTAREQIGATVHTVLADSPDIASSTIRERLSQGLSIEGWMPRAVIDYIEREGIYR